MGVADAQKKPPDPVKLGGIVKLLLALTMSVTMAVLLVAAGAPTVVTYVPHDKVSATMAKGGSIVNDQGLVVLANRRGAGEVEVHEKTNHVFIIVEGEATLVTGGTLVGARQTSPDQRRASSIQGGETHHMTKGDVITIPAKTPHWWKEVSTQTIAYYAVNIEN
jgi:mannose-6-phosphate isomerase-like protein (cupin superfamily)